MAKRLFLLLLPAFAISAEPAGNRLQLLKLNQASQQELRDIQRENKAEAGRQSLPEIHSQWRLNQQQKIQQQVLQEQQRRKQMIRNQQHRVVPEISGRRGRPRSIFQLQQFQRQQFNQLDRFRTQQQLRLR